MNQNVDFHSNQKNWKQMKIIKILELKTKKPFLKCNPKGHSTHLLATSYYLHNIMRVYIIIIATLSTLNTIRKEKKEDGELRRIPSLAHTYTLLCDVIKSYVRQWKLQCALE